MTVIHVSLCTVTLRFASSFICLDYSLHTSSAAPTWRESISAFSKDVHDSPFPEACSS
jgi:hypothetical protein